VQLVSVLALEPGVSAVVLRRSGRTDIPARGVPGPLLTGAACGIGAGVDGGEWLLLSKI